MLTSFFMICAIGGGAFILAQVLLSIFALGVGHGMHLHHGSAGGHASAPRFGPRGGFLRHWAGHKGGPRGFANGSAKSAQRSLAHAIQPVSAAQDASPHWAASWLHGLFTFQGLTAGAAVLGLSGLAATSAKLPAAPSLAIAVGAAFVMMAAVAGLLELMSHMEQDGTVRIDEAVGQLATVYLSIPPSNQGLGKISVTLQQRLMEFPAVTAQQTPLAAGQKVIIISVKHPAVMEVVSAENYLRDIQA